MTKRYVLIDDDDPDTSSLELEAGPVYSPGSPPIGGSGLLVAYAGLMEAVGWRQRGDVNEYNEPTYIDSMIDVIWYDDLKLIRNEQGEELQQFAYIQTTALIQQGDAILRAGLVWPIVGIQRTPTFDGEQFRIGNLGQRMI
jgi:hypothetical protein